MGKLIIKRKKKIYDFLYNYKIIIDGVAVDEISGGQTSEFMIEDNQTHSIYIKHRLFTSPTIMFKVENQTIIEIGGVDNTKNLFIIFMGIISVNLFAKTAEYKNYIMILILLMFVFLFIAIHALKKKKLTITEISSN